MKESLSKHYRPLAAVVGVCKSAFQPNNTKNAGQHRAKKKKTPSFPSKASPLFCTFDKPIADHINKVGGFCFFLLTKNINAYDFQFCHDKEVWIFHLDDEDDELALRFAYALLRHGASKVQIQCFLLEDKRHV